MNASAYLDTRSVLVVALTMAVLMGLVSLAFGRLERGTQALRLWGWSLLVFAVGMGLVALRGKVPDLVGVLIGDTVLFAAAIPMLRSVRRLNAEPAADIPGWVLVALGFVLIAFWTLVMPDATARIVVFSAIVALQYFRIAYHLFNTLPEQGRSAQVFTAAVIACFSASSAARMVMTLMAGKVDDLFQPSYVHPFPCWHTPCSWLPPRWASCGWLCKPREINLPQANGLCARRKELRTSATGRWTMSPIP